MNFGNTLLWGFAATVVLSIIIASGRGLALTRIDLPFLLGTIFTPDRDKARLYGTIFHFVNGWIFAFIYAAAFTSTGLSTWWFGALIGLVHALFVLVAGMPFLPALHPRMASETTGPDPTRLLEPPGFLSLNYGAGTPIVNIFAHVVYGGILGYFYHP